ILCVVVITSCGDDNNEPTERKIYKSVENLPEKDAEIQRYNLKIKKEQALNRTACDTLALTEYILDNYPAGTYLIDLDKTLTYNIPSAAVIYYEHNYIFALI